MLTHRSGIILAKKKKAVIPRGCFSATEGSLTGQPPELISQVYHPWRHYRHDRYRRRPLLLLLAAFILTPIERPPPPPPPPRAPRPNCERESSYSCCGSIAGLSRPKQAFVYPFGYRSQSSCLLVLLIRSSLWLILLLHLLMQHI